MNKMASSISGLASLVMFILMVACGGKNSHQAENAAAFDSVRLGSYSGYTEVEMTHKVKDYKEWLKVYADRSDPDSRLSIFASPEDPNLITIFELTNSHEAARNAFSSQQFAEVMRDEGVTSEPIFNYYDIRFRESGKTNKLYRLGVSHEVQDYEKWKKIFDEDEPVRARANLELRAISTNAENPKMVNIMFATDDIDKAKEVINSDELRKRMTEAGVRSEPVFAIFRVPSGNLEH